MKKEFLLVPLAIAGAIELSRYAFSQKTKERIRQRAIDTLGYLGSEASGRNDAPLECAHLNHNKALPNYDHESNGILLTVDEHLDDHYQREGNNGLSNSDNRWAITQIRKRVRHWKMEQRFGEWDEEILYQYKPKVSP